ncbi:exodeoxyribonuclease V subunit gamma [Pseudactinotalea terrae]|uniref:exodeoxyribonuclease V subunit gamma n=1 Tax=Pseudactinotalea terrae TaxID=1743262 RepID=UPI0012E22ADB|nr:exodeoxyribonuclease V subunit gamma [Pseudactinotalea terrae]
MAVHIHRAHRTDRLADELGRLLATPMADPFAEEVVVVPARGVERWLTQRLSHRLGAAADRTDGVCAGVRLVSPRSLVAQLTGTERTDPWDPDRLAWPLLATIDEVVTEPWAATLATHLGAAEADDGGPARAGQRQDRRYSVARRLAGLLSGYAVQRPAILAAWRAGDDSDGHGHRLDADLAWQAELYRRLEQRLAVPPPDVRHAEVLARIRAGEELALPDRLSLFGHTRLPVTEVELLAAVGEQREVHLWLPQASAVAWEKLRPVVADGPVLRARDETALKVHHPLLASLGRDARELQRTLSTLEPAGDVSVDSVSDDAPETLLGWLQHDLRADVEPDAATRAGRVLAATDDSVQVHACHGPARQVEVLREVLVGMLADDPTLEPRDILVMCPDIESFASLFEAGFGLAEVVRGGHPAHELRVRLADRGLARTNPLLDLAARVVEVAGGRAAVSEILDLASTEVVRRRFGFSDDDLEQIGQWVVESGVRWGLAADLRQPFGLAALPHNTWKLGLDRLLVGVGMAEQGQRRFGSTLPLDDVGSAAIDLAGRLAELIDRLESTVRALGAARRASEWVAALGDAIDGLGAVGSDDAWQRAQADRELATIRDAAGGQDVPLRLADVRTLLEQRLSGRATRANFRTGALTVSTMVPMRSVPHRVIALVGLDDGAYPRLASTDGDDALARMPRTGERDVRGEDRQLLLDALLAATEHLVLTYTGADEVKGGERPPAVPIGEVLDALDVTSAGPVRDQVVVCHPLQPFDPRNFTAGALSRREPPRPFAFDAAALEGARAASGPRRRVPPFLVEPLAPVADDDGGAGVLLADLQYFFSHPVRAFVRRRLDIALPWENEEPSDSIPVELDSLQAWAIGDRVLSRMLAGEDLDALETAERARGEIPPLQLGQPVLDKVHAAVTALEAASAEARTQPAETVDVTIDVDGVHVTGQVPDVRGHRIVRVTYSSLGARQRLAAWVDLLALTVAQPEVAWTAEVYGGRSPRRSLLGPVDPENARAFLGELLDIYARGQREPLPLPLKTSAVWAETPGTDSNRAYVAYEAWHGGRFEGEQANQYYEYVWGPELPLRPDPELPVEQQRGLLAEPARSEELWSPTQSTRFGQYAVRLWKPLLEHEQRGRA